MDSFFNDFFNLMNDWFNHHFNTCLNIAIGITILYALGVIWNWPVSRDIFNHGKSKH